MDREIHTQETIRNAESIRDPGKKTIFLTGASGNMGFESFRMLLGTGKFRLRLLVLPDKAGKNRIAPYSNDPDVTIFWGNLTSYQDVQEAMGNPDIVLHVGAMIPPAADHHPDIARHVNYGGTLHVIRAVREHGNCGKIRLVFIGTVAESGNRLPPVHWERVGDPIMVSRHDAYAESKVMAERAVIEAGLPYWVSLRQTAMLHFNLFNTLDPILYHHPLNTHMEWVTVSDSARVLLRICEMDYDGTLPGSFWKQVYNIGGGPDFRKTNIEFMESGFGMMGIRNFRKVVNPNWFATGNFHGCWFLDSDLLESILHFRQDSYEGFFTMLREHQDTGKKFRNFLASMAPAWVIKYFIMLPLAKMRHGTLHALKRQVTGMIETFWGSMADWVGLPHSWKNVAITRDPSAEPIHHGYNEETPLGRMTLADLQEAAEFRGGTCLSRTMATGDMSTPLEWECGSGHIFTATPRLILKTGHWCPYCDIDSAHYTELGKKNRFLGQVAAKSHRPALVH